ncbi:hypothetical protein GCM10025867_13680 [Frondihabitans sucicola]|uniref:Uncharacterized protein n=1 Tax=Frondihabitans sucicola TaxID=1268041 RepID=A0ABM8GL57_9MICO|nr:hypothetical protein GCM10025867_13680 [Frondihabitans sucicola]
MASVLGVEGALQLAAGSAFAVDFGVDELEDEVLEPVEEHPTRSSVAAAVIVSAFRAVVDLIIREPFLNGGDAVARWRATQPCEWVRT